MRKEREPMTKNYMSPEEAAPGNRYNRYRIHYRRR